MAEIVKLSRASSLALSMHYPKRNCLARGGSSYEVTTGVRTRSTLVLDFRHRVRPVFGRIRARSANAERVRADRSVAAGNLPAEEYGRCTRQFYPRGYFNAARRL